MQEKTRINIIPAYTLTIPDDEINTYIHIAHIITEIHEITELEQHTIQKQDIKTITDNIKEFITILQQNPTEYSNNKINNAITDTIEDYHNNNYQYPGDISPETLTKYYYNLDYYPENTKQVKQIIQKK